MCSTRDLATGPNKTSVPTVQATISRNGTERKVIVKTILMHSGLTISINIIYIHLSLKKNCWFFRVSYDIAPILTI